MLQISAWCNLPNRTVYETQLTLVANRGIGADLDLTTGGAGYLGSRSAQIRKKPLPRRFLA